MKKFNLVIRSVLVILMLNLVVFAQAQTKWFVASNADPQNGIGTAANPYLKIQQAVTAALSDDSIFIAPGMYMESDINPAGKNLVISALPSMDKVFLMPNVGTFGFIFNTGETAQTEISGINFLNYSGAAIKLAGAAIRISNCTFKGGSTAIVRVAGGATDMSALKVTRSIFNQQTVQALSLSAGGVTDILHCTFFNSPTAINASATGVNITSSVFSDNTLAISSADAGVANIDYSLIFNALSETNFLGTVNVGPGSLIGFDPMFVNPSMDDFNPKPGSPVINKGNPAFPFDLDGSEPDMGAIPFQTQQSGIILTGQLPFIMSWGEAQSIYLSNHFANTGGGNLYYELTSNTNPEIVEASISDGYLNFNFFPQVFGTGSVALHVYNDAAEFIDVTINYEYKSNLQVSGTLKQTKFIDKILGLKNSNPVKIKLGNYFEDLTNGPISYRVGYISNANLIYTQLINDSLQVSIKPDTIGWSNFEVIAKNNVNDSIVIYAEANINEFNENNVNFYIDGVDYRNCEPFSTMVNNYSYYGKGPEVIYTWSLTMPDKTVVDVVNPDFQLENLLKGNYSLTLKAHSVYGQPLGYKIQPFFVTGIPDAFMTSAGMEACPNTEVIFGMEPNNQNLTWYFGAEEFYGQQVYRKFTDVGEFPVRVTGTSNCGNFDFQKMFKVTELAVPDFQIWVDGPFEVCPSDEIFFKTSFLNAASYLWDFGNGVTRTTPEAKFAFGAIGLKTVKLTVTNTCGQSASKEITVNVVENKQVFADFNWRSDKGCAGTKYYFETHNSGKYLWDFGDGTTSTLRNPTTIYSKPGEYVVKLTVTNGCGAVASNTNIVYVNYNESSTYDAYFEFVDKNGTVAPSYCTGEKVTLETHYGDEYPMDYTWTFKDGTILKGKRVEYSGSAVGIQSVQLIITDICGNKGIATREFAIKNDILPVIAAMSIPANICPNEAVYFWDEHFDLRNAYTYTIDFGDGTVSEPITDNTTEQPRVLAKHVYSAVGIYNFKITAKNLCGNIVEHVGIVTVSDNATKPAFYYISNSTADNKGKVFAYEQANGTFAYLSVSSGTENTGAYELGTTTELSDFAIPTIMDYGTYLINDADSTITLTSLGIKACTSKAPVAYKMVQNMEKQFETVVFQNNTDACANRMDILTGGKFVDNYMAYVMLNAVYFVAPVGPLAPDKYAYVWFNNFNVESGRYQLGTSGLGGINPTITERGTFTKTGSTITFTPITSDNCTNTPVAYAYVQTGYNITFTDAPKDNCFVREGLFNSIGFKNPKRQINWFSGYTPNNEQVYLGLDSIDNSFAFVGAGMNGPDLTKVLGKGTYLVSPDSISLTDAADSGMCPTVTGRYGFMKFTDQILFGMGTDACPTRSMLLTNMYYNRWYNYEEQPNGDSEGGSVRPACPGDLVQFSAVGGSKHDWTLPSGTILTGSMVTTSFTEEGIFPVIFKGTNNCARVDSLVSWAFVSVNNWPQAYIYTKEWRHTNTEPVEFFAAWDEMQAFTYKYEWDFGDGSPKVTVPNPKYMYANAGEYTVRLSVTNGCGTSYTTQQIYIQEGQRLCEAKFNVTVDVATKALTLTNYSSANAHTYYWDFGDGNSSTDKEPAYTYAENGFYTVKLTVRDTITNCVHQIFRDVKVGEVTCNVDFSFEQNLETGEINFTSKSTPNIDAWFWSFGDYTFDDAANPTHAYAKTGYYLVTLTGKSRTGVCGKEVSKEIYVELGTDEVATCNAGFSYIIDAGTVVFYDNSEGKLTDFKWDMGDGKTYFDRNVVHQFTKNGMYTVTLQVYDAESGCQSAVSENIEIKGIGTDVYCFADFKFNYNTETGEFIFTNFSKGDIESVYWELSDGAYSDVADTLRHTFEKAGWYTAHLIVYNITTGCFSEMYKEVYALKGSTAGDGVTCKADFEYWIDPTTNTVSFFNKSSVGENAYVWAFGNGKMAFVENPVVVNPEAGVYNVCLTIKSKLGCISTQCYEIKVEGQVP
ncbi:MAG TPA: hypothetical protein DCQ31_02110, partial [Bacteroidales bacterium]|nr:hypothetical protein [Bacteroidales bacterium]